MSEAGGMLSVLLDEHLSVETAYQLTAVGFRVTPARDRGLLGCQDWELLPWCIEHDFAICTRNGREFERQHLQWARGKDHFGVLIVGWLWTQEEIYWALRQYLEAAPDPALLVNQVVHLPPAAEEFIRERTDPGGAQSF
jgi:Domain of unknown function (DUF5615)